MQPFSRRSLVIAAIGFGALGVSLAGLAAENAQTSSGAEVLGPRQITDASHTIETGVYALGSGATLVLAGIATGLAVAHRPEESDQELLASQQPVAGE